MPAARRAARRIARLIGHPRRDVALVPSASRRRRHRRRDADRARRGRHPRRRVQLGPVPDAGRRRASAASSVEQVPFGALAEQRRRPTTTLVAFSLIQSQSGRAADQRAITDAAQARERPDAGRRDARRPVCRDRLTASDFVVCAAYKHLLSPRGVAFLSVAPQHWESAPAWLANWRSTRNPYAVYYGGPLDQAPGAARFDVSLAWHAWAGAAVSLELLARWQASGVLDEPRALARRLAARARPSNAGRHQSSASPSTTPTACETSSLGPGSRPPCARAACACRRTSTTPPSTSTPPCRLWPALRQPVGRR